METLNPKSLFQNFLVHSVSSEINKTFSARETEPLQVTGEEFPFSSFLLWEVKLHNCSGNCRIKDLRHIVED